MQPVHPPSSPFPPPPPQPWADTLPTLTTPRLHLRWLIESDAPAILSIFGDPEVMRYWSTPPLPDLAAAHGLIQEIQRLFHSRSLFQWGIESKTDARLLGTCTLYHLDLAHRRAEIGFALGRHAWGHGFGTEAIHHLITFAFDTLLLHRLEADVDPDNHRSLRLLERLGFVREGYLRQRWHHLGRLHDAVFLGLLRTDFRKP